MPRIILPVLLLCAVGITRAQTTLPLIPWPRHVERQEGSFPLQRAAIRYADPRAARAARFLADQIRVQTGLNLPLQRAGAKQPLIRFTRDPAITNPEGYALTIRPGEISVRSAQAKGYFWAVQTLRQLLPDTVETQVMLPCLSIQDEPSYAWRSNMLDVGRHFFPVSYIKKHLDLLSFYKINTFHWHLTDDQGWRIEIRKYPRLTSVGAWRREADGRITGGFYTQQEIRDIVAYARQRNITVIPEIEMPGHCRAALAAYPELSCLKKPLEVPAYFGVMQDVYCAGQEKTYQFVEDVLNEVLQLFPSPYIHIGGDECPKDRWKACPVCQRKMKEEGLQDEHALQSYFVRRIQQFLQSKGRHLLGWDEILEGGADRQAIVEVWRGQEKAQEALSNGNRIIQTLYFDSPPASLTLEKTFHFNAAPAGRDPGILGAECPLWTEGVTEYNVEYMMFPRLQAFGEALWNGSTDYASFHQRLASHYAWMTRRRILFGAEDRNLLTARLRFQPEGPSWKLFAATGTPDMRLFYSLEGDTTHRHPFRDSFTLAQPAGFQVTATRQGRQAALPIGFSLVSHLALGKKVSFLEPYSPSYGTAGDYGLTDGITGSWNYGDGSWLAWQGKDLDAVVDLGSSRTLHTLQLTCLQETQSWILLPREVTYFISNDGQHWEQLKTLTHQVADKDFIPRRQPFVYRIPIPLQARYVRVKAVNYGTLPAWHNGAGGQAWIFADEFIIR
ncbi:MAG TPA: family 20 glycosylhydrolase [Chitinophagaceae bacterium]|nr:family 20 glycosylhydrolase [Chitinophagaceae bacterium]